MTGKACGEAEIRASSGRDPLTLLLVTMIGAP